LGRDRKNRSGKKEKRGGIFFAFADIAGVFFACHPERSEGSAVAVATKQILRSRSG
jgi:hypothetical protein